MARGSEYASSGQFELSGRRNASHGRKARGLCAHGTCGLVAMTSASHAEGRQFDPGQVYSYVSVLLLADSPSF